MGGSGSGGHNRKPATVHQIHGTARPNRGTAVQTLADLALRRELGTVGNPPRWIDAQAKSLWRALAPELTTLGILTQLDETLFTMLCVSWSRWRNLTYRVAQEGTSIVGPRGRAVPNPMLKALNDEVKVLSGLAAQFGLTPSTRKRLTPALPEQPKDEMEALLSLGGNT